ASRPTAVNLAWALQQLRNETREVTSVAEGQARLRARALALQTEDERVCRSIGEHALALFEDGDTLMTICNAGTIATSRYGTALAPFYVGLETGKSLRAVACETRPVLQGARLTVWELHTAGVPVTLITDNMAAARLARGDVKAVIVGADRIAANGDAANKIGTLGLAILAQHFGVPFYVCAPHSTFDRDCAGGEHIEIEQRHPDEVRTLGGQSISVPDVDVWNPAFDVTPAALITGIITEHGVIERPSVETVYRHFQ
ncbi:MAG: S-methyl-5-thioribose-1-phosphate isomerase, partial [Bacilli bacterium]